MTLVLTGFEFIEHPVVTVDGVATSPEEDPVGWTAYQRQATGPA